MRVFLGLEPPEWLRADLRLQQFLLPLPKPVPEGDLHLTLVFCGQASDSQLDELHLALSGLRAQPLDLCIEGLGLFGGEKPHCAWAGVAASPGLLALQARLGVMVRQAGLDLPHRRFVPHITLGRFRRLDAATRMRLERAVAAGAGYRAGPWRADQLVLWQSELMQDGPRYTALARYAFADPRHLPPGVS